MAKDILSEYGPNTHKPMRPGARSGGVTQARDVHNYQHPQGPTNLHHSGPGLGGDNYGHGQQPVCREREYGSQGIKGTNKGNRGSQR